MKLKAFAAAVAAACVAVSGAVAGCSGGSGDGPANQITVWSLETEADRIRATQQIISGFTAKTGIKVKLVGVAEDQLPQLVTSNAASGNLPDVIGALPLAAVHYLAVNNLVDGSAVAGAIDGLGRGTFDARSLQLTQVRGKQVAVPSDAWIMLLIYRKDLFDKAGLPAPNTYDKLQDAARKLNSGGTAGITLATAPGDSFTQQTFETLALANGCQLVDGAGNLALTSPPCVEAFRLFTDLVRNASVQGNQDVDSTRATYLSGKAAMVVWSTFLLDELAGLRGDTLPSCPECKSDPAYLAKNSGFVTALRGPSAGKDSSYGEVTSWTITNEAKTDAAKKFVTYMLDEGYGGWLGVAPEGKFPVRKGTPAEPEKFVNAWGKLQAGVDKKALLSKYYPADVLGKVRESPTVLNRWGFDQGQGQLAGAILGELPLPKALNAAINGTATPDAAARQAQQSIDQIKKNLR
jgi:multiple sugar transport system substrate-binding protein